MSYYSFHNPTNIIVTTIGIFLLMATNLSIGGINVIYLWMVLISLKEYENLTIDLGLELLC
jgi:hypothetical protein